MSKWQRETLLKGSRNTERAAKVWHWPRLFKKKLGQGFWVNKRGLKIGLKEEQRWGSREVEEISADEVMRAAKPGCSSSQIKTQTHQTHCNVNIIPPPNT